MVKPRSPILSSLYTSPTAASPLETTTLRAFSELGTVGTQNLRTCSRYHRAPPPHLKHCGDIWDDLPSALPSKLVRNTLQDVAGGIEQIKTSADRAALQVTKEEYHKITSALGKQRGELHSTSSDTEKEILELK